MKKIKKRLNKEKYYNNIDLLRLLSCIAILLYHLNILKGGYLAVCAFLYLLVIYPVYRPLRKKNFP